MRSILASCLAVGVALSLAPVFAPAQSGSAPPATLHVDSQIVLLDVSVIDASGKPVTDLRQDEFRITERKAPQTISSFEPPSAHELPPMDAGKVIVNSTADLGKIGQAPITILSGRNSSTQIFQIVWTISPPHGVISHLSGQLYAKKDDTPWSSVCHCPPSPRCT